MKRVLVVDPMRVEEVERNARVNDLVKPGDRVMLSYRNTITDEQMRGLAARAELVIALLAGCEYRRLADAEVRRWIKAVLIAGKGIIYR